MMAIIGGALLAASGSPAMSIVVKATIITAAALGAARLARQARAAVRHVLLAVAFAALVVLPIASVLAPAIRVAVPIAPTAASEGPAVQTTSEAAPSTSTANDGTDAGSVMPWPARVSLAGLAIAAWGAGAVLCLVPVMIGLWQVRALRRSGLPWEHGQTMARGLAADAGITRHVDLWLHESTPGPTTSGVVHPAIVVPVDAQTWPDEDVRRAIVHELEHVRRGDWLTQAIARIVCAAYWFHPLVWIAWRRLALDAERACDDAVLRRAEATAYADQLVALAQRLSAAPGRPQLAMANRHDLATRVLAVLDASQRRGRAGTRWIAFACAAAALFVTAISPLTVVGQVQPDTRGGGPKFDAASIRPCKPEEAPPGPARGTAGGTNATFSTGRMYVPCVTVEQLIYLAYAGSGATVEERLVNDNPGQASDAKKVRGGPAWVHSQHDKYAVEATATGASERTVLLGGMLRTLIEDRFHLKIHREAEEEPMYALTVAKSGLKIRPMKPGDCEPFVPGESFDATAAKPRCGSLTMGARGPNTVWAFVDMKLSALSSRLDRPLGRHVIDQTGITDDFIFRLEFHPDENTPGIMWPAERDADASVPQAASIFTAVEEQLGLKLEKTKGQHGFLVIDRIERPSPNGGPAILDAPPRGERGGARPGR